MFCRCRNAYDGRVSMFGQLVLILVCGALTRANLTVATNETIQVHATTIKPFVSERIGFHTCYDGRCQCRGYLIKCYMKGITVLIDSGAIPRTTRLAITCDERISEHALKNATLPYRYLHKKVKFTLENCMELPEILRRVNISYMGSIRFSEGMQVPADFFRASNGLQRLRLDVAVNGGTAGALPAQLFHNLSQLRELRLVVICQSYEVSLPVDVFHTLFKLEKLLVRTYISDIDQIVNTALRNFTGAYFRDTPDVTKLLLDGNYMDALPADVFATLTELTELSLSLNELVQLPSDLLKTQHKLIKLDISGNALKYLPRGIFDTTPLLWELALAGNQLYEPSNIIAAIRPLRYLHRLNLSHNRFVSIAGVGLYQNQTLLTRQQINDSSGVQHLYNSPSNLTLINLSHNRITHFNLDDIVAAGVACPYEFDFSHNHIQHIYALRLPPSSYGSCLRKLNFASNPLQCDCALAWIYNTNFSIVDNWECAGPARKLYVLPSAQKQSMCAWSPTFCPERCECIIGSGELQINCAGAQLEGLGRLPRPEQFSLPSSKLDISHNRFYELPSNLTFGYGNVSRIYAAHNLLSTIQPAHLPPPPQLSTLDLRSNRLERLSAGFLLAYLNESATLQQLYLSENPWLCDCEAELLLFAVREHRLRIPDAEGLHCANWPNATLLDVPFAVVCASPPAQRMGLMRLLLGVALAIIVLISALAIYYKYSLEINVWLYAHDMFLCCIRENELDKHKTFDAFISYAHQDEHFVNHILIPGLKQCNPTIRLCTHERNWLAGAYIPEQIVESVAQSRRTIIVLSNHFVASDWARMEFRTAHQCSLNEGRARIIIIKYGEIANSAAIDKELRAYLDMNTYLEWADCPWFWSKLRYAMPHRKGEGRRAGMLELDERQRVYVVGDVEMNRFRTQ